MNKLVQVLSVGIITISIFITSGVIEAHDVPATYYQRAFQWLDDDAALNSASGWGGGDAVQDAAITGVPLTSDLRLRIALYESENSPTTNLTVTPKLQYALQSGDATCTAGTWTDVPTETACSTEVFCQASSNEFADGDATTETLFIVAGSFLASDGIETNGAPNARSFTSAGEFTEWEWMLNVNNAAGSTDYKLRLVYSSGATFNTYTKCPGLTTSAAVASSRRVIMTTSGD